MRAAVLGSPITHSLSPVLHRAAYAALGLGDWTYQAIECDEAGLAGLLRGCGPDWAGLSLTMPLKRAVLPLVDWAEPLVTEIGGANTVLLTDGRRHGYNTDVPGMVAALAEAAPGPIGTGPDPALILGGGVTACAALAALRELGVPAATAAVRDPGRAGELRAAAQRLGISLRLAEFGGDLAAGSGQCLVISTVPAGAAEVYAERIAAGAIRPGVVLDVAYHPWPTPVAVAAAGAGAIVASGFDLLLHQAARQVELMAGRPAPVAAMRAAGSAALAARAQAARVVE